LRFLDSTVRILLRRDDELSFGGEFEFVEMSERFQMAVTMTLVTGSRMERSQVIYMKLLQKFISLGKFQSSSLGRIVGWLHVFWL
jgi:hypothetical protein